MTSDPGPPLFPSAFIGVSFQASAIDAGTAAVSEGNRILNCRIGGPYHDTFSTKDLIVRNNYYLGVTTGPFQAMGGLSLPPYTNIHYHSTTPPNDRIKRGGADGKTATFTTQYNHGFEVGQAVRVADARVNGEPNNIPYNGYFPVEAVTAPNQFTYRMATDPQFDADATPVAQFAALWQTRSVIIENNIIELIPSLNGPRNSIGMTLAKYQGDPNIGDQKLFLRVVIRGNIIRHVDNLTDPTLLTVGILLHYCKSAIVEDNVIDLDNPTPLQHYACDSVEYFNNTNSSGKLIQGVEINQAGQVIATESELTTDIQDAVLLTI